MANTNERVLRAVATPKQCLNAGQQLIEGEGFYQVVVGARLQAANAVLHGVLGREDQNVSIFARLAKLFQQGEAVQPRQHQVQDDQVVIAGLRPTKSFPAIAHDIHGITGPAEPIAEGTLQARRVFDQQNSHGTGPRRAETSKAPRAQYLLSEPFQFTL